MSSLADRVDAILPQTQCTKCGYPACRPYAEALAKGEAGINQCPPGGDAGVRRLAALLARPYKPLDPAYGAEQLPRVAVIDETRCIGCTLCIKACPVDAIVGARKMMHTVVTELCTGCDLCLPPCPVDCIDMIPSAREDPIGDFGRADAARERFEARKARLERRRQRAAATEADLAARKKRAIIQAAVERARARRARA